MLLGFGGNQGGGWGVGGQGPGRARFGFRPFRPGLGGNRGGAVMTFGLAITERRKNALKE